MFAIMTSRTSAYTHTIQIKEQTSISQTLLSACVCTRVQGLITVLVLKVIVHQEVQPQFNFCTRHRKRLLNTHHH